MTRNLTITWDGATALLKTLALEGELESVIDATFAAGNNQQLNVTVDVDKVVALLLIADKDCLVETNSGSSPVNVFTLTAGKPFLFVAYGSLALRDTGNTAVTVDITGLFVTTTEETRLQGRILTDATP
ncbi:MAG: hypothetical protein ABMA13_22190 [Chthoniobacteraceae bacterium]